MQTREACNFVSIKYGAADDFSLKSNLPVLNQSNFEVLKLMLEVTHLIV
jgi:hypothetical protein